jgi:stage II sporulation protein AB (anti-sigma F factor)
MQNYMKLEIAAIGENECFARSAVAAFALCLNPTLAELSDIKTAVSEAVTNSIVHAYKKEGSENTILLECKAEGNEEGGVIHITVTDGGCGIEDTDKAMLPFFTTLENDERSGMGFTIMQTFMDGFRLESERGKGTKVAMFRRIGGGKLALEKINEKAVKERADA